MQLLEPRTVLDAVAWIGPNGAGGSGNWDVAANWLDKTTNTSQVPGSGDNVTIDTGTTAASITIQSGDNISVESLTTTANDTLSITGGSLTLTVGTSALAGPLDMTGGSLTASGSGASVTANGATTVSAADLFAGGGATLSLPTLSDGDGASFVATGGATLNLPTLTAYTGLPDDTTTLEASGTGSVLQATQRGTLNDASLTTLQYVNLTLDNTGTPPTT